MTKRHRDYDYAHHHKVFCAACQATTNQRGYGTVGWLEDGASEVCPRDRSHAVVVDDERRKLPRGTYGSKRERTAAREDRRSAQRQGTWVKPTTVTQGEFRERDYLPTIANLVAANSLHGYRKNLSYWAALDITPIQSIDTSMLQRRIDELASTPSERTGKLRSRTTLMHIYKAEKAMLADAVRRGLLMRNPADAVIVPKSRHSGSEVRKVWTAPQVRDYLRFTASDRLHLDDILGFAYGLRVSERCGLRWSDFDLDAAEPSFTIARVRVSAGRGIGVQEPKSRRSRRTLAINAELAHALRLWKLAQEPQPHGGDWLLTTPGGRPMRPDSLSKRFMALQESFRAEHPEVRRIVTHGQRHTFVTLMLASGVQVVTVSELAGHSSVGFTLSTYAHALPDEKSEAIARFGSLLGGTAPIAGVE